MYAVASTALLYALERLESNRKYVRAFGIGTLVERVITKLTKDYKRCKQIRATTLVHKVKHLRYACLKD